MADKGTDSRLKLTVTEVKERQPVGDKGAVKLTFMATEGESDKALSYFTFSSRLFETIEQGKGKELDCDVNISTRNWTGDDGNVMTFTDRKVTQIYIDGQPVGGKRFGGYGDSPEKIASIEAQSRAKIISELWIAGKFDGNDPEVKKLRAWLTGGQVSSSVGPKKAAPKQKAKEPEEDIFPEEQSMGEKVAGDLRDLPIVNLGNLFSACLHHFKMNQSEVLKELGTSSKEQISDPGEAWLQIVEAKS